MRTLNPQNVVLHKGAQQALDQAELAGWEEAFISLDPGQKWPCFNFWSADLDLSLKTTPGYTIQILHGYAEIKHNHPILSPEKVIELQKLILGQKQMTNAQGKAIANTELRLQSETGYVFSLSQIYPPDQTAQSSTRRQALHSLMNIDLVAECNQFGDHQPGSDWLITTGNIKAAYDEWYRRSGFKVI